MIEAWLEETFGSFSERVKLDWGVQEKRSFFAKVGGWDWQMRIVVANKSLSQYICPLGELSRQGVVRLRAVPRQTCRVFHEGFGLPCFASPFGACETVCLCLKTCVVQVERAEEL